MNWSGASHHLCFCSVLWEVLWADPWSWKLCSKPYTDTTHRNTSISFSLHQKQIAEMEWEYHYQFHVSSEAWHFLFKYLHSHRRITSDNSQIGQGGGCHFAILAKLLTHLLEQGYITNFLFCKCKYTERKCAGFFSLTFMSLLRGLPKTSSESRSFTSASRTSTTCWTSLIVTRCGIARFPLSRTRIPPAQEKALPSIWRGSKGHLEQVLHEWDVFAQDYIGKCCMSEMILLKITRWSGWCWEDSVWSSQFWHSRSGDTHERVPFLLQQSFGLLRGGWKADPRQELAFCIS